MMTPMALTIAESRLGIKHATLALATKRQCLILLAVLAGRNVRREKPR
jgi:hypothetical protein